LIKLSLEHYNLAQLVSSFNQASSLKPLLESTKYSIHEIVTIVVDYKVTLHGVASLIASEDQIFAIDEDITVIVTDNSLIRLTVHGRHTHSNIIFSIFSATLKDLDNIKLRISEVFPNIDRVKIDVEWYYSNTRGITSSTLSEIIDDIVYPEAYPYIDLQNYVNKYIFSSSQVLILIGPPGTGKSRLIRYIIRELYYANPNVDSKVFYTGDSKVIEDDEFYIDFLSTDASVLILEDTDLYLKSRADGNNAVTKLLFTSDGLIKGPSKKIILSTNLPNTSSIDDALIRPGRCFDALRTRLLTTSESNCLLDKLKKPLLNVAGNYSLAQLYNM
jgi:hypothetical protein